MMFNWLGFLIPVIIIHQSEGSEEAISAGNLPQHNLDGYKKEANLSVFDEIFKY